eukprot:CAMPEP_0173439994 /NCGR_PEP_ID=MMETSP1357-20121228/22042_1 /TAXON_ID=77926 /ORGANISM="Hemiselmis rufescens, Strain PCC563" /LENGTH=53 /DNA_ID=CAMNT_0014405425 /DNA_START=78 /DNA_END=236 /DNA_ORIENTATION=+
MSCYKAALRLGIPPSPSLGTHHTIHATPTKPLTATAEPPPTSAASPSSLTAHP